MSSDSSLRRLAPQWSRKTLSEGCSTPATPRMQGANRRSSGETLRLGRIGESPRNVGWPRAWTLRTGEPSRTQDLSALMRQVLGAHVLQEARVSAQGFVSLHSFVASRSKQVAQPLASSQLVSARRSSMSGPTAPEPQPLLLRLTNASEAVMRPAQGVPWKVGA